MVRVYTDVRPSSGTYVLANATTDAVRVITPPPGEYVKIDWIQWSMQNKPSTAGYLQIKEIDENKIYVHVWISDLTFKESYHDIMNFGDEGLVFGVGESVEVRLNAPGTNKALAVSFQ